MRSVIAKNLIKNVCVDKSHSDFLWKNADVSQLEYALSFPTLKTIREYLTILQGAELKSYGKVVGSSEEISKLLENDLPKDFILGLIENPYIKNSDLEVIKSKNKSLKSIIEEKIEKRIFPLDNIDISNFEFDFFQWSESDFQIVMNKINTFSNLLERNKVISKIYANDKNLGNSISLALLLGENEGYIDSFLSYLVLQNIEDNNISTILGALDSDNVRGRISNGALAIFFKYGFNLYNKDTFRKPTSSTKMSDIDTLKLLGESDQTILSLIFNTNIDISGNYVSKLVSDDNLELLSNFFKGGTTRKPKGKECREIISNLSGDLKDKLKESLGDLSALENAPWFNEIAFSLPSSFHSIDRESFLMELYDILRNELGVNSSAWDFFLVVANEWNGDIYTLIESSLKV